MNAREFLQSRLPVRDLTMEAEQGLLRPAILANTPGSLQASHQFFERMASILFRTARRQLLVTGQVGVGKTTTVIELARRCHRGEFQFLRSHRFLLIDVKHVGPEDSRACLETISTVLNESPATVLCLDGLQALMRRSQGSSNKTLVYNLMHHSNKHRLIGIVPWIDYGELFASDRDCTEFFEAVEVHEPDTTTAEVMVQDAAQALEHAYGLDIAPSSVRSSVFLTSQYILNDHLPGKAVKILRGACDQLAFERHERGELRRSIQQEDVLQIVAQRTGIPVKTLTGVGGNADWEAALGARVVGQPAAIHGVADELRLIKAGLTDTEKPASVMLFAGMTGVGKTELAKRLAELYSATKRLQNYSMANFTEPHSVSGIIGVPPGYVGHEEGGRLINDLQADPYSVFLLDEAEKAHPNIWKPFLTLFDEGWIVDQRGVKAHADRAVFILTTNVGSEEIAQMTRSGKSAEEITERVLTVLSRHRHERSAQPVFPPAFLTRIRRIIVFQPLEQEAMHQIALQLWTQRQRQWSQRHAQSLTIDEAILFWISETAHQRNEQAGGRIGGRVVQRLMAQTIDLAIAHAMASSNIEQRPVDATRLHLAWCEGPTDSERVRPEWHAR